MFRRLVFGLVAAALLALGAQQSVSASQGPLDCYTWICIGSVCFKIPTFCDPPCDWWNPGCWFIDGDVDRDGGWTFAARPLSLSDSPNPRHPFVSRSPSLCADRGHAHSEECPTARGLSLSRCRLSGELL